MVQNISLDEVISATYLMPLYCVCLRLKGKRSRLLMAES